MFVFKILNLCKPFDTSKMMLFIEWYKTVLQDDDDTIGDVDDNSSTTASVTGSSVSGAKSKQKSSSNDKPVGLSSGIGAQSND